MRSLRRTRIAALLLVMTPAFGAAGGPPDYDAATKNIRRMLETLVAADTTNPPGNESRAVAIVAARLKEAGIPYEITEFAPGRENLVARLEGSGKEKPLLLLAHTDVVGAAGQSWTTNPHVVTERDGYLIGRGVADDLGMAATALETLILLRRADVRLRRDVVLALTGDEETGGSGVLYQLEHKPRSLESGIVLNEGGHLTLGDDGRVQFVQLQTAEKIYQDFELGTQGTTGHSSVPKPDNAIYRLARALDRIGSEKRPARLIPVTRAYLAARAAVEPPRLAEAMRAVAEAKEALPAKALAVLEEDPILTAMLRTTCVATIFEAGTKANALPASARANVNCRILPDETIEATREALVRVIDDSKVSVTAVAHFGSGPASPIDGPGPEAIARIVEAMWPGTSIIPTMSLGATDSRFFRGRGTPAYGIGPIAISQADATRAHGIDERIPVASLRPGIEFFYRLVVELAEDR